LNVADSSKLNSIYLWGLLTQPVKRVQIKALASGSAGSMPNISKARLKTLDIEVPPLDRQTAYAQALEQIISIRSQQATATAKAQATFDALLADAFKAA
jgi:type I restriction enzyme S subunit